MNGLAIADRDAGFDFTGLRAFERSRLVKLGYIVREPQQMDRRRFTHRVVFGDDDSWRNDQLFPPVDRAAKVGGLTNDAEEKVGETTNKPAEIVGDGQSGIGGISSETGSQYISLNEELHSDKTEEINSVETAHRENATRVGEIDQVGEVVPFQRKKDRAEAPLASEVSISASLTPAFSKLLPAAKLVRFEAELARIGRRFDLLPSREQRLWIDWLLELTDSQAGDPAGHHALRLWEEVEFFQEQAAR